MRLRQLRPRTERLGVQTDGTAILSSKASDRPDAAAGSTRGDPGLLRKLVRRLDGLLRRVCRIQEFVDTEECLLRVAIGRSRRNFTFADGTRIARGELIGELHLWNEHVPALPDHGPDLGWALLFRHRLRQSLRDLAGFVARDPEFQSVRAFRGEGVLGSRHDPKRLAGMAGDWGFEVAAGHPHGWQKVGDFCRNVYTWGLLWAFIPGSTKRHALRTLRRDEFWMTRQVLLRRYGTMRRPRVAIPNRRLRAA